MALARPQPPAGGGLTPMGSLILCAALAAADSAAAAAELGAALAEQDISARIVGRDEPFDDAEFNLIDGGALYDDGDPTGEHSGAGLAARLRAPLLLVLPAQAGARAAAALARGFAEFGVEIAGLILTGVGVEAAEVERLAGLPVLGAAGEFDLDRLAALATPPPHRGEVYLVGAGPGAPDLLTLRAVKLIQRADVALFDRLARSPVMDLIPAHAERIYVGKRPGAHALTQDEISALMVRLAREGKRVLRLKGGDPFLFGRGGEEAEALAAAGVPFEVCPGVTAASGAAASALIPLTHRDHAQACIFVTGQGKDGPTGLDWPALIRANQTVAIYMGLANLDAADGRVHRPRRAARHARRDRRQCDARRTRR